MPDDFFSGLHHNMSQNNTTSSVTPRQRVLTALNYVQPDRVPVDFLATPEIWHRLADHLRADPSGVGGSEFSDPLWEAILRYFQVDCRVISYDQFCNPPAHVLHKGAVSDWWNSHSRSTPNRMWRQVLPDGDSYDIWGHHIRVAENQTGAYEEFAGWPLEAATSVEDLKNYPWPDPDWWDFRPIPGILAEMDSYQEHHIRFRIGSVFEIGWQLRGMQAFLMDLAVDPAIPLYVMDRLTDVHVENLRRVLKLAGERIDMVYFYDDVATQKSLMLSRAMWEKYIRPRHLRIIEAAKSFGTPVMYHCDGAISPLIPELIDMGVDLLNPVQANVAGMEPESLKATFGNRLSFHGGIDIVETLPNKTPAEVAHEVRDRISVLGRGGGYIMASSHHIQSDTPLENIFAMYDLSLR